MALKRQTIISMYDFIQQCCTFLDHLLKKKNTHVIETCNQNAITNRYYLWKMLKVCTKHSSDFSANINCDDFVILDVIYFVIQDVD